MQFSVLAVFSLVAVALATPHGIVKRDVVSNQVTVESASMTDKGGNVVPFDSKNVFQAAKDKGL